MNGLSRHLPVPHAGGGVCYPRTMPAAARLLCEQHGRDLAWRDAELGQQQQRQERLGELGTACHRDHRPRRQYGRGSISTPGFAGIGCVPSGKR